MIEQKYIHWAKKQLNGVSDVTREAYGDQSKVFKLRATDGNYFLKIGTKLEKEREKLEWLNNTLPVPQVVGFTKIGDEEALLLSAIDGKNLAVLSKEWIPEKVVNSLVVVLRRFHAVNTADWPFGNPDQKGVLVHGDACLPNFIFQGDNFSGYIDLGDARVANPEVDFSAVVWSLQHNLGNGYGKMFLRKCGMNNVTDSMVEEMRLNYEAMQKEWGLL